MTEAWNPQPLLDRLAAHRSPEAMQELWRQSARVLEVDPRGCVALDGSGRPGRETDDEELELQRHVLLGLLDGQPWFARRVDEHPAEVSVASLRDEGLGEGVRELLASAAGVLAWHDRAHHCELCAAPTTMASGGFHRTCTQCGRDVFPRTDPAMIVGVLDEQDRLLLAHQSSWPEGRVSILAGFLEAGESAEHAVVREVREESGLEVHQVRYLSSQPWPYPRSLMLGFSARARGEVCVDGQEIAWARWYTPEDLTAAEADGLTLPGLGSIAGRIIQRWREGTLPAPEGGLGPV
ncbi:NAD(+) diphosphatase [Luteococcus sediminum]|uniref:NAD(+) diphosphatase n=1 Tax=Luteococcus sp. TaxID=1969402 RepID=UPI0037369B77